MGRFNLRRRIITFTCALLAPANRFLRNDRGNVAVIVALLIIPVSGLLSLAGEVSGWYAIQRAEQNAADSAAVAAASNAAAASTVTTYVNEARSVAGYMNFVNGQNNTTVTAASVFCGGVGLAECYKVTITKSVPIYLAALVGYHGSTGNNTQTIVASAVAGEKITQNKYCLLALDSTANDYGIDARGAPAANLQLCPIMSNSNANCSGHNLNAGLSTTVGNSNDCGTTQKTGAVPANDPYNPAPGPIPSSAGCSAGLNLAGGSNVTWGATMAVCGNVNITGSGTVNVTTPSDGTVLLIKNGTLNIGSNATLKTLANSGLTIIFQDDAFSQQPYPTGGGTLDIAAPTSNTQPWHGVALYADPSKPGGSFTYTGNSPTWDITGLVYFPKDTVTMKGAVNKSTNGYSCIAMIVWQLVLKGTADIFYVNPETQCNQANVAPPSNPGSSRIVLVQ